MNDPTKVGIVIVLATLFLDLLELAFAKIVAFVLTLRFLLYFVLHCIVSVAACFALHSAISQWYVLALVGTFLGVGILSNSDVKIAGQDLVPLGTLFREIKAKMIEQAGEEKAAKLQNKQDTAALTGRLRVLPLQELRGYCGDALQGARWKHEKIQSRLTRLAGTPDEPRALAALMLSHNLEYVKAQIEAWERAAHPAPVPGPSAP